MKIQMVDLKGQYEKIKAEVDAGIQDVINNTQFIKGPQIKVFEDNLAAYLGVKHVIACANGTDALQVAMMALNLKPGDEVILPVFTYVATAEVIALLGLVPVMVDVDPETFCIDTHLIESKISDRTKAIVPVHLFGQCANMDEIMRIAKKHNLFVIEDTAQALGAKYRSEKRETRDEQEESTQSFAKASGYKADPSIEGNLSEPSLPNSHLASRFSSLSAGCIGDIGTTSFFPSKNLGCYGDGGALMTNDDELAKKIRMICNHGQSVQYVHDTIGVNSRLDSIQAAVLNVKLKHLKEYEAARNQAAHWYDEILNDNPHLIIPKRNPNSTHVFHQYTIRINYEEETMNYEREGDFQKPADMNLNKVKTPTSSFTVHSSKRDQLRARLAERGIPTMVYYPIELHKQKAFASDRYKDGDFPVSEMLCNSVLSLPIHTEMTKEMVEYICRNLTEVLKNI